MDCKKTPKTLDLFLPAKFPTSLAPCTMCWSNFPGLLHPREWPEEAGRAEASQIRCELASWAEILVILAIARPIPDGLAQNRSLESLIPGGCQGNLTVWVNEISDILELEELK